MLFFDEKYVIVRKGFQSLRGKCNDRSGGIVMSVQLLDKTRKINKLLHNNNSSKVIFNDICEVLTEILDSNIY